MYQPHKAFGVYCYTHSYGTSLSLSLSLSHSSHVAHTHTATLKLLSVLLTLPTTTHVSLRVFILMHHMYYLQMYPVLHIVTIIIAIVINRRLSVVDSSALGYFRTVYAF